MNAGCFIKTFFLCITLSLWVTGCNSKKKEDSALPDPSQNPSTIALPAPPTNFIVNGETCPGAHCPGGVYSTATGGSVVISATFPVGMASVSSTDSSGSFQNMDLVNGSFIFVTNLNLGDSRSIQFESVDLAGNHSEQSGITISAVPGALALHISPSLTASTSQRVSGSVTLQSFGTALVSTANLTDQTTRLEAGFTAVVGRMAQ